MKYKILLAILAGLSILIVFSYCFLIKSQNAKNIVLKFSSWGSESEVSILKPVIADFEKNNPDVKIEFMHVPQNYFQKIQLLFASNTAPDIIFMNNQYLPIYANAGVLEDLTPYEKDFNYKDFYPQTIKALSYKGKIYAIPRDVSNLVIYYNKDIFDKYDVAYPKDSWTYEEFLNTAKLLTHKENKVWGISFEEEPLFYLPYLMSFGVENVPDFNDVKTKNSIKLYADLRNKYRVAPLKRDVGSLTMAQMFLQEKLAMHLSGRWLVPKYRQEAKFKWDVVRFPKGSSGSIVPIDSSGWAIAKSSTHKSQAIKFIKYLSSKSVIEKFTQTGLIVPARVDVANSKYFIDGLSPQNSKAFTSTIETSKPTPVTINYRKVIDRLRSECEYEFNRF